MLFTQVVKSCYKKADVVNNLIGENSHPGNVYLFSGIKFEMGVKFQQVLCFIAVALPSRLECGIINAGQNSIKTLSLSGSSPSCNWGASNTMLFPQSLRFTYKISQCQWFNLYVSWNTYNMYLDLFSHLETFWTYPFLPTIAVHSSFVEITVHIVRGAFIVVWQRLL